MIVSEFSMLITFLSLPQVRRRLMALSVAALIVGVTWSLTTSTAQEASGESTTEAGGSKGGGEVALMREGSRISSLPAVCRSSGERLLISFEEDSKAVIALENLAAQRILQAVLDDVADAHWIVGGQITEFQDRNYILLDRVIRQPKSK
jgi:hypothetical protein